MHIGTAAWVGCSLHHGLSLCLVCGGGDAHLGPCRAMWGLLASNYLVEWTPT